MAKKVRTYFTIPLPLMEGWWKSYDDFNQCLFTGLQYNILAYTYECDFVNTTDDDVVKKAVHESFNLSRWNYDNETHIITKMRKNKQIYDLYHSNKRPANYSIRVSDFWDFLKNEKSMDDVCFLMAFMSVKSLLGKNSLIKTNKHAITARMACNTSLRVANLPKEIAKWQTRKMYDKLKRVLFERYHLGFYSDTGIRGTYVSAKQNENNEPDLVWLIEQAQTRELTIQARRNPLKEAIKKVKLQHPDLGAPKYTKRNT